MIIKMFFFLSLFSKGYVENEFTNLKGCFVNNLILYMDYLSWDDEQICDLERLHLIGLRYLIDTKLGDLESVRKDLLQIFELTDGNEFLTQEFKKRYNFSLINHLKLL
jgi:hypothetical protein